MTEYILLNRPKINEIPDFIPISKGGSYENIALPSWLKTSSIGVGIENAGTDFKLSSLLFDGSAEERILKDLMGVFYIKSGMDLTKKSADTIAVSTGKFHIKDTDYDFTAKDVSITGKANGYYYIVVDASGDLSLIPRANPPDRNSNMLGKVFVKNNNIDQLFNNGKRIDSTVNILKDLIHTDGVYAKHIAIFGATQNSMLRSDGTIVAPHVYDQNGTQTQKDLQVENPVKVEIRHADGSVLNQANTTVNVDNLRIMEYQNTTIDKKTSSEYLVIPMFVDVDGNVILLRAQSSIPNKQSITEIGVLNALSVVTIPLSIRSIATMVGVLILQGTETSLVGSNAFYEPFKNNKNTILRTVKTDIPTANRTNTGQLLGWEDDKVKFVEPFVGSKILTDVFIKEGGQARSLKSNDFGLLLNTDFNDNFTQYRYAGALHVVNYRLKLIGTNNDVFEFSLELDSGIYNINKLALFIHYRCYGSTPTGLIEIRVFIKDVVFPAEFFLDSKNKDFYYVNTFLWDRQAARGTHVELSSYIPYNPNYIYSPIDGDATASRYTAFSTANNGKHAEVTISFLGAFKDAWYG